MYLRIANNYNLGHQGMAKPYTRPRNKIKDPSFLEEGRKLGGTIINYKSIGVILSSKSSGFHWLSYDCLSLAGLLVGRGRYPPARIVK